MRCWNGYDYIYLYNSYADNYCAQVKTHSADSLIVPPVLQKETSDFHLPDNIHDISSLSAFSLASSSRALRRRLRSAVGIRGPRFFFKFSGRMASGSTSVSEDVRLRELSF